MLNLIVTNGADRGQNFELGESSIHIVGRLGGAVSLLDRAVSRIHAELRHKDGQWYISDMGSINGTIVNGQQIIDPTPLNSGDQIRIGKTIFIADIVGANGKSSGRPAVPSRLRRPISAAPSEPQLLTDISDDQNTQTQALSSAHEQIKPNVKAPGIFARAANILTRSILVFSWSVVAMSTMITLMFLADTYK